MTAGLKRGFGLECKDLGCLPKPRNTSNSRMGRSRARPKGNPKGNFLSGQVFAQLSCASYL